MADQMLQQLQGMQYFDPNALAQLQADQLKLQQRQQMAQSLINSGYVPNSGKAGVLTALLSGITGGMLQRGNDEKVADILRRQFEVQNQAAMAKRQQDLADEQRKLQNDLTLATGKSRAEAQAKKDFAIPQFQGGGVFDPTTGTWTGSSDFAKQQIGIKSAEADAAARATAKYREAPGAGEIALLNAKIAQAQAAGATQDQIRAMITGKGANEASQWQVVGSNRVNKVTGEVQPLKDAATGQVIPSGTDAKSISVVNNARKGLANEVLSYVSATTGTPVDKLKQMTPEEVSKHYMDKGSGLFGGITGTLPGGAFVNQMLNPTANAFATAAQAQEARIQHPVGTIPYNAEVLARKSSIGPEKTDAFNAAFIKKSLEEASGDHAAPGPAQPVTKVVNGQTYVNINGQWYQQ